MIQDRRVTPTALKRDSHMRSQHTCSGSCALALSHLGQAGGKYARRSRLPLVGLLVACVPILTRCQESAVLCTILTAVRLRDLSRLNLPGFLWATRLSMDVTLCMIWPHDILTVVTRPGFPLKSESSTLCHRIWRVTCCCLACPTLRKISFSAHQFTVEMPCPSI